MSKEQIEKMARDMDELLAEKPDEISKHHLNMAAYLYGKGWRCQEWISVEDRLPEAYCDCLISVKVGDSVKMDIGYRTRCFDYRTKEEFLEWVITNDWDEGEGYEITHWMYLPEPPKK